MRYDSKRRSSDVRRATDDWQLLEIERVGNGKRPCSDAYLDSADASEARGLEVLNVFTELIKLRAAGVPPDQTKGNPDVQPWKGKCSNAHKQTTFYVLKSKPGGWRLYFHVQDATRRQVEFLLAVHKKRDRRDPADFAQCCRLLAARERGDYVSVPVELPRS